MASPNLKVKSGNKIVVSFDGKQIGLCQSVDMRDDYGMEPASGIGDIHVIEHVPTLARHTINVEEMVLLTGSLRNIGVNTDDADKALQGLIFDITVIEKESGELLRKYTGVSYASGSVTVRKNAIVVSSAAFNALSVSGTGA